MAENKSNNTDTGMTAAVLMNGDGNVCINFDDPSYVRAQCVYVDKDTSQAYALLDEMQFLIGEISDAMLEGFDKSETVLLTGTLPEGKLLELYAPVVRK